MSHFVQLDDSNIVVNGVVGNPDYNEDANIDFLTGTFGGKWLTTSYSGSFRGNYAGIGYSYLPDFDIFMPPKCHDEAILEVKSAKWECVHKDHDVVVY